MSKHEPDGQLDFFGLINEYTDDQGATVRVREPGKRKAKPKLVFEDLDQLMLDLSEDNNSAVHDETPPVESKPESVTEQKPEVTKEPKPEFEHQVKVTSEVQEANETKPKTSATGKPVDLFPQCSHCWCHDCKHNARTEAVPREMCGRSMPCPACNECEETGSYTICEIGNPEEGCMLRAVEEGLVTEEEII